MEVGGLNWMFIGFPGPSELVIIFLIILVLFGGSKLPEMARNIGKGMRIFKEEANALRREIEIADQTPTADKAQTTTEAGQAQDAASPQQDEAQSKSDKKKVEDLV